MEYLSDALKRKVAARILRAPHTFFFLDYDGTLTPIRPKPTMAHMRESTRDVLQELSRNPGFSVGIVSGRQLDEIRSVVAVKDVFYVGNQGLEIQGPDFRYTHAKADEFRVILRQIGSALKLMSEIFPGSFVEDKEVTLSYHYRMTEPDQVPALRREFLKRVSPWLDAGKVRVMEVKKALEVRPDFEWNKGSAARWLLLRGEPESLPVFIGDDGTDELAFRALNDRGITIKVGHEKLSHAQYYLKDVCEVERFLSFLSILKKNGKTVAA